jgi:hypothetical protein
MAHPLTLPAAGLLALAGIGAGVQLGYSAISEIDPSYFRQPPTRFHADLAANRPIDSSAPALLEQAKDGALGTACIGCRTFPEEYVPIHEASVDGDSSGFASTASVAAPDETVKQPDEEEARLRHAIQQVELYARGSAEQAEAVAYAATAPASEDQREDVAVTD